jgi:hypothetical protein
MGADDILGDPMRLEPPMYKCKLHDIDVTDEVKAALGMESPVAIGWAPPSRAKEWEPFRVVVRCPGNDGDSSHRLRFSGRVMREDGRNDESG